MVPNNEHFPLLGRVGKERMEKINSFPNICLFLNLRERRKQAARPEATRSLGSDTFYLWCLQGKETL